MCFMNDLEKHVSAICGKKPKQNPKSGCTPLVNSHRIIARTTRLLDPLWNLRETVGILGKPLKAGTNINTLVLVPQVHRCVLWKYIILLNLTLLAYSLIARKAHKQSCQTPTEASNRQRLCKIFENNTSNAPLERRSPWGKKRKVARFGETRNSHSSPLATENGWKDPNTSIADALWLARPSDR